MVAVGLMHTPVVASVQSPPRFAKSFLQEGRLTEPISVIESLASERLKSQSSISPLAQHQKSFMSDKADGSELIKDKSFQNLLEKMDNDADAMEKQWKTQLANAVFADFPADFLKDYKNDGAAMIKARGAFNAEWNKIVAKKGDPKKLLAAYDAYSGSLEALYESNTRFQALIELKLGPKVEAILKLIQVFGILSHNRLPVLEKKLKDLEAAVEEADKEVTKAEAKAYLNAIVSTLTLAVAAESALARAGTAAAGIAAHVVIEYALGQGTAKGTIVAVAGDAPSLIKKFSEAQAKFAGATGMIIAGKLDADELGEDLDKLEELRPQIQDVRNEFDQAENSYMAQLPYLEKVDATLDALADEMDRAMKASVSAKKNYDAIKSAIKKTM
jgi:hypothetical protein